MTSAVVGLDMSFVVLNAYVRAADTLRAEQPSCGVRWTALVMLALLVANTGVIISEFVGIAQASELLGIPRFVSVPLTALIALTNSYN